MGRRLALLALAGALLPAPAFAADAVALFDKLCVGGEARFAAGDVVTVERSAMPRAVRKSPRPSPHETIYKVNGGTLAFLIVQGDMKNAGGERSCSIVAADTAPSQVITKLLGRPLRMGERATYDQGGTFHQTLPEGGTLSTDVVPPNFVVATVRQGVPARH